MQLSDAQIRRLEQFLTLPLLSPDDFAARWTVSYQQIAQICCCSTSTVEHWFSRGTGRRSPAASYQKLLALADFLLTYGESIQHLSQ